MNQLKTIPPGIIAFEDTSIFKGIVQFYDTFGVEYRAQKRGRIDWLVYRRRPGADGFQLFTRVKCEGKKPRQIYDAMTDVE